MVDATDADLLLLELEFEVCPTRLKKALRAPLLRVRKAPESLRC